MNCAEFIKALGLGTTGLILPKNLLSKSLVKIYDNYVKGMQHYQYKKVKKHLAVGEDLILKRENTNIHDAFAVEVYFGECKLGYLLTFENIVIANMLDQRLNSLQKSVIYPKLPIWKMETLAIEIFAELIAATP